jgi:vacuolar-type H+-ATPase subunit C/Vma6
LIAGIFRYSYAQAKTRALKGKLLSPDDWHCLLRMRSIEDLLRYLRGTDYAPFLRISGSAAQNLARLGPERGKGAYG